VRNAGLGSLGLTLQGCGRSTPTSPEPASAPPLASSRVKPSFIVVVMDDARFDDVLYMDYIPVVMAAQGLTFANAYVAVPLCAPSRVSILTGRYGHNHHVWSNDLPKGGYVGFHNSDLEGDTIAVWLKQAGYRTMLAGKYLNHYPDDPKLKDYVPPGWDEWYVPVPMNTQFAITLRYKDALGREGWEPHRKDEYEVDVIRDKTVEFINRTTGPFFAYVNPVPPHLPHQAAPRFDSRLADLIFPKPPSFNEANLKDKPWWVRGLPRLTRAMEFAIIEDWRARLRSLLAVDEMIKVFVDALAQANRLESTYVILTSDNGWFLGEHRYTNGKDAPYEEATRAPLMIRGPGVPAGKTLEHVVSLVDLAPTLLELAQAPMPAGLDGLSLAGIFNASGDSVSEWRRGVLFEAAPQFAAIRTQEWVYIAWDAFTELYNMKRDPYQTRNLLYYLDLQPDAEAIAAPLAVELNALTLCRGGPCRQ